MRRIKTFTGRKAKDVDIVEGEYRMFEQQFLFRVPKVLRFCKIGATLRDGERRGVIVYLVQGYVAETRVPRHGADDGLNQPLGAESRQRHPHQFRSLACMPEDRKIDPYALFNIAIPSHQRQGLCRRGSAHKTGFFNRGMMLRYAPLVESGDQPSAAGLGGKPHRIEHVGRIIRGDLLPVNAALPNEHLSAILSADALCPAGDIA
ncbi:hypothetical protein SDC9_193498 [bioreactor metagenome]|uniref:Uncharacterized protein n=1 Tax=bioreactor metagenome TaxID=1076179 RepID=A0A645I6A2_9ZZZZ